MVIRRGPIARKDGDANSRRSVQPNRNSKKRVQTHEGSVAMSSAQTALSALVINNNNAHKINDMDTMSVYSRHSTNTIRSVNYNSSPSIKEEWLRNFKPFPIPSLQYITHTLKQEECAKKDINIIALTNESNNNKSRFNEEEYEIANTQHMHFDYAILFVNLNYIQTAEYNLCEEEESNDKLECWHTLRSAHEARTSSEHKNSEVQWEEKVVVNKQQIFKEKIKFSPGQEHWYNYLKAAEYIAKQLNRQYRNIGFDSTEFFSHVDNNVNNVTYFLQSFLHSLNDQHVKTIRERQSAHFVKHNDKCILLHYNGHGVGSVTKEGCVWFASIDRKYPDEFRILDVLKYLPCSAVVVIDCNKAGNIIKCWQESDLSLERTEDFFFICACRRNEVLPRHPALPADVLTSCLTTPLRMALEFHIHFAPELTLIPNEKSSKIHFIPGSLSDITTPRGELNFVLSTITFTIAWSTFDAHSFTRVFCSQSKELKTLFCNALLADRILRTVDVTPQTFPALPTNAHIHLLWNLWDYTLNKAIQELEGITSDCTKVKEENNICVNSSNDKNRIEKSASSQSSTHHSQAIPETNTSITSENRFTTFFNDQLTAFELWVNAGDWTEPPYELPSVINATYYAEYRTRATTLLLKYFDICPSAVGDCLLGGLLPIMEMLMKSTPELLLAVMMMWAKVIQICPETTCAAALEHTICFYEYFMYILELKSNLHDWTEIKCGEVAPVHKSKIDGSDMEMEIKRNIAAKELKYRKTLFDMSETLATLKRSSSTKAKKLFSSHLEEHKHHNEYNTESHAREQAEELQEEQVHELQKPKRMHFYLLSGVSLERCKCIACYLLCELLEEGKKEEKRIQLWNSSLLNVTLPLLSSTSVEIRSWSCLLLSQLALHLPHAKEVLSRECMLHLEVFTSLLSDDSPLVRSSCVTLLASIMGTRIDLLEHDDQLKRLRMEILMLSRLRACLPDASMAVRSEIIYFACQVLYHYCPIIVEVSTEKVERAEHLEVLQEEQHEEQQNNDVMISELEQEGSDTVNNYEIAHEDGHISSSNTKSNTPSLYIRDVLHNLTNLTLDKIEWMNVERDISVHSKLSENRPTLNVAFDDTIVFEMTSIETNSPLLSHPFDVSKLLDKSITLVKCLLHDAETMLYYLFANCDAERVRCALNSMLGEDADTACNTNDIQNNNRINNEYRNNVCNERSSHRHPSRNQLNVLSPFSPFASSSSLPPLHSPQSFRFALYAKNTMSRMWTDVNATVDHISEAGRTRHRWNDDTMRQLVFDFQDRKRQFRPTTSYIPERNYDKNNDVNISEQSKETEANSVDESQNTKLNVSEIHSNANDISGDSHENKKNNYDENNNSENNIEMELPLIQAPCHQIWHSLLHPSSVVCNAFRALEPSVMMVNQRQTFMYMLYSDFHTLKLQSKFKLEAERAPVHDICVINDLSEEAALLVVNKYGGMNLVKNCFTPFFNTVNYTDNNSDSTFDNKCTINPEIVATFAACPPFSAESMMRSVSARGTDLTQRAKALKERRVINLKLLYHSFSAALIYGGFIGDNNETEIHVLSLHHEQVIQKLRLGENVQLTSLASHPTQQVLIAGCKDGSLHFFDKRQRERGQFGLLKSFKHNAAQIPIVAITERDERILDDVKISNTRINPRLDLLSDNSRSSTNRLNNSVITDSHQTVPNVENNNRREELESTFAPVSNAILGVGVFARNGYYTFITTSPSSVNVFDSRKTNEPIIIYSAYDLHHLYSPYAYDQFLVSCEPHSFHKECYSHRTSPLITSCTISPFTELVGLTFSDNSYGLFNDKMELLHDKLVIAEAFHDSHTTSESLSNLFLSPYSIFNSPPSSSESSPVKLSKPLTRPILSSSANIHPLRSMMTFGGSVLSYHQL